MEPKISSWRIKELIEKLNDAASRIANQINAMENEYTPQQLQDMIGVIKLEKEHQSNKFDPVAYQIAAKVIDDTFGLGPGQTPYDLPFHIRFEHQRIIRQAKDPSSPYYLLSGPFDGNTNLTDSLEAKIGLIDEGVDPKHIVFTPPTCITFALVHENDPWHPIISVVHSLLHHTTYTAILREDAGYDTHRGYKKGVQMVFPERELERFRRKKLFKIFVADYVNDFRRGPAIIEEYLIADGRRYGFKIQPVRAWPASSPNLINVFDQKIAIAYVDPRAEWELTESDIARLKASGDEDERLKAEGDYAVLLFSNIVATCACASGFGMEITDIHHNKLGSVDSHKVNIPDINSNPRMTLLMVPPEKYYPRLYKLPGFDIHRTIESALTETQQYWYKYIGRDTK